MKILITGGAGFIGSHLADAYLEAGHEVAVLDDLSGGKETNLPSAAKLYKGSITDASFVGGAVSEFRPEVISHHAGQVSVAVSVREPAEDADSNILGTITVIEAAKRAGVRKIIFPSSGGTVYGGVEKGACTEDWPLQPESPYALSKSVGERYIQLLARDSGLAHSILRYGNVYGPRQDPHGEAGVSSIFAQRMLEGEEITIFGGGTPIRDYINIKDIVVANLVTLEKGDNEVFNICTGVEISTNRIYEIMREAFGYRRAPVQGPWRPGDVPRIALSPAKAEKELNWRATVGLDEGLAELVEWYKGGKIR